MLTDNTTGLEQILEVISKYEPDPKVQQATPTIYIRRYTL